MNVVLTCLLTNTPDPQRGEHLAADPSLFVQLRDSVHHNGRTLTVLHDCLDGADEGIDAFVMVEPGGNPYFYRWRVIADEVRTLNPDDLVWCVDATDVEMLHDPFPQMQRGIVYTGSEPWSISDGSPFDRWLRKHCPSRNAWYDAHPKRPFLNMGILGGSAEDIAIIADQLADSEADGDDWEIGAWQQIAHDQYGDVIQTGEPVHTLFRAQDRDHPSAWWRHK